MQETPIYPNTPEHDPLRFSTEIRIHASAEAVWESLTQSRLVNQYHLAPLKKIDLKTGGDLIYGTADKVMISGVVVDFEKSKRLVHSFRFCPDVDPNAAKDPETLVTYEILPQGDGVMLVLTHSGFVEENQTRANIMGGWPHILSGLKSVLEKTSLSSRKIP